MSEVSQMRMRQFDVEQEEFDNFWRDYFDLGHGIASRIWNGSTPEILIWFRLPGLDGEFGFCSRICGK